MVFEAVDRIVGRADDGDLEPGQDAVDRKFRGASSRLAFSQISGRVLFIDDLVDPEVTAQLEVRPVVERVAQRLRDGARVRHELVVVARVLERDQVFGNPIGPHCAPLVVVASKPDLVEVLEPAVGGDLVRWQVAMVVENGLAGGMLEIESARPSGREQEIVGEEGLRLHIVLCARLVGGRTARLRQGFVGHAVSAGRPKGADSDLSFSRNGIVRCRVAACRRTAFRVKRGPDARSGPTHDSVIAEFIRRARPICVIPIQRGWT